MVRFGFSVALTLVGSACLAQEHDLVPADQAGMEQCLQSAYERGARPEVCIGFVYNPCAETVEGQTTVGMIGCVDREHGFWDRLLNQSYRRLGNTRDEGEEEALRDLQRQWLAWRDARCDWEASLYEGGTLARVVANQYFTEETARRAIDLTEAILEDGDNYRLEESE